MGLAVALLARIVMVVAGIKLLELTSMDGRPRLVSLLLEGLGPACGRVVFDLESSQEIHSTVELEDHGDQAKARQFFGVIMQILILDIVFSGLGHHCRRANRQQMGDHHRYCSRSSSSCFSPSR